MKCLYAVITIILLTLLIQPFNAGASTAGSNESVLNVRAWDHSDFFRIVIEGPGQIISKGEVRKEGENIIVRFPDTGFRIEMKKSMSIAFETSNDQVVFSARNGGRLKTFVLEEQGCEVCLVIDSHKKTERKIRDEKPDAENSAKEADKEETVTARKPQKISDAENNDEDGPAGHKPDGPDQPLKEAEKKEEPEEKNIAASEVKNIDNKEAVYGGQNSGDDNDEYNFIAEEHKKLWTLLKSGNFYGVLKILPEYKPDNAELLASYHFIYAQAYSTAQEYLDAIEHYRLAYIYAAEDRLKSRALLNRAELYHKLKLNYEARADYLVYIRDFPDSKYLEKAHFGLSESLSALEDFSEAVLHYRKAGSSPEALFGLANTMQKLGRAEEAQKAYADALKVDIRFPDKNPETNYLLGENMRMTGDLEGAKKHLTSIQFGQNQDKANISLGLIAMMESDLDEAIRKFRSATRSRDRRIRIIAYFNLSKALLKKGDRQESISSLEEIRNNYPDASMYKEAILDLSRLYRKEGRIRASVSLLKELVYGKHPPRGAFNELESILLEEGKKSAQDDYDGVLFTELWNEVGQWMLHESREKFLLKIAGKLRHEGSAYIEVCSWLVDNASRPVSMQAALDLADYYIDLGNIEISRMYFNIAKIGRGRDDAALRVESKMCRAEGDLETALSKILSVKNVESNDLKLLGDIFSGINEFESEEARKALAFYEEALNTSERRADDYIRLADILYENNRKGEALKYYRIALKKEPENEWVAYRVGDGSGEPVSKEMFSRLQKGDSMLSQLAKTKLMEMSLLDKMDEVY